jgi:Polyketide cyclase / dehydrase and lipid transport
MAVVSGIWAHPGLRSFTASVDVMSSAEDAFAIVCAVEKWPVWLSFLRSSRLVERGEPLRVGSDVVVRTTLPEEEEQLFEVDGFIANYHLSLVGAYSIRRRLDFRIERKTTRSKVRVRLSYPAYHGRVGMLLDGWRRSRRLSAALDDALEHFKGLVEYRREDGILEETQASSL